MTARAIVLVVTALCGACSQCAPPASSPAAPPSSAIDGGAEHSYVCPIGDSGESWQCSDGVSQPVGTCDLYGCVEADSGLVSF